MSMEYQYETLKAAALAPNATQDDINALGEWFQQYGMYYWNGESFEIDETTSIFPICAHEEDEYGCFPLLRYEIR